MSTLNYDQHTVCIQCREIKWLYRKLLANKSKKKVEVVASFSSAHFGLIEADVDKKIEQFGKLVASDMYCMFDKFMEEFRALKDDRPTNPSFQLPRLCLSMFPVQGAPWEKGPRSRYRACGYRCSGRGAVGLINPPLPTIMYFKFSYIIIG